MNNKAFKIIFLIVTFSIFTFDVKAECKDDELNNWAEKVNIEFKEEVETKDYNPEFAYVLLMSPYNEKVTMQATDSYSEDFYNIDYDDYYKTNAIGSYVHFEEKSYTIRFYGNEKSSCNGELLREIEYKVPSYNQYALTDFCQQEENKNQDICKINTALGVKFLDSAGSELQGRGADLAQVAQIDATGIDPRLLQSRITVMCDVDNPLCGTQGATHTYARQKGATDAMIDALELGMKNYQQHLLQHTSAGILAPGAGAAGGLGAALQVFARANMRSGIEMLLDLYKFDDLLAHADVVVTGEGRVDHQSAHGKVLWGIARRCREHNVPLYALVGSKTGDCREIIDSGVTKIYAITDNFPLDYAMTHAQDAYLSTARRMFQEIISKVKLVNKAK